MTISPFRYVGTPQQQKIAHEALELKCDFPWDYLSKKEIPVDWQDLSRYNATIGTVAGLDFANSTNAEEHIHVHDHDTGDTGHPVIRVVDGRAAVLGLAWYSGRITIHEGLVNNPPLAHEVLLAEGAHMVDFFYMRNEHRVAIINALHIQQLERGTPVEDGKPLALDGHTCSWFDVGPYRMWVGEAFMEAFIRSFGVQIGVTINLGHPTSLEDAEYIRKALLGPELVGTARGKAYHHPDCPFIRPSWVLVDRDWVTEREARHDGRRACLVCHRKLK